MPDFNYFHTDYPYEIHTFRGMNKLLQIFIRVNLKKFTLISYFPGYERFLTNFHTGESI